MSTDIASRAMEVINSREDKRLEEVRKKFLQMMQKEFDERVQRTDPWTAVGEGYECIPREKILEFDSDDLVRVATSVGFTYRSVPYMKCDDLYLGIPEWTEGTEKTPAQLMLFQSNIDIGKRIKEETVQARQACKRVLNKIERGEFQYEKCCGYYKIEVKEDHPNSSEAFMKEATNYMTARKFEDLQINKDNGVWILFLAKN